MKVKSVYLFDNGNSAVFDNKGRQIVEIQESWFLIWLDFMIQNGVDIESIDEIKLPSGKIAKPFKIDHGWNWDII